MELVSGTPGNSSEKDTAIITLRRALTISRRHDGCQADCIWVDRVRLSRLRHQLHTSNSLHLDILGYSSAFRL
jgi:hypothetical protein